MPLFPRLLGAALLTSLLPLGARATDALPRWREQFPAVTQWLNQLDTELVANESPDDPLPTLSPEALSHSAELLSHLELQADDTFKFDPIHGPETPFNDHGNLRQIASLRTCLVRHAVLVGDHPTALRLLTQNLRQTRATFTAQAGILPFIHAVSVWQTTLDGIHNLARSPRLTANEARLLLTELQADSTLAQNASARALWGEYVHVYKVIVERMPATDDPDLFLSSVGTLGMEPPEPLEVGELGLGLTQHRILDVPATLAAYEADLAPYLAALKKSSRLPPNLFHDTTARTLALYRTEIGAFYDYACGELADTYLEQLRARIAMESTRNPGGKLLAIFLTPPWEALLTNALRREAQRAALCGLLAWRINQGPTTWEVLVAKKILPAAPADPFSTGTLHYELGLEPRIWSVFSNGRDDGGILENANLGQPNDLVWMP